MQLLASLASIYYFFSVIPFAEILQIVKLTKFSPEDFIP